MEKIYYLLNSYIGMYVTQSVFHSAVAAVIADISIAAWNVREPLRRQAMRVGVILIPIITFPLYQLWDASRGTLHFRLDALLDTHNWLLMQLWGKVPVIIFFILVLAFSALIFLLQELLPIISHTVEAVGSRKGPVTGTGEADLSEDEGEDIPLRYEEAVLSAMEPLPGERPEVVVIDDDEMVIFSSTGRVPAVYVSTGLIDALESVELRGAIAHEIAHIKRTRRPILTFLFVFRVLLFFNPVALFEFRRAVQDEEEICDDEAASVTGEPASLSSALGKFIETDDAEHGEAGIAENIERYSHDSLIRRRMERLSSMGSGGPEGEGGRLPVIAFVILTSAVNYFIV